MTFHPLGGSIYVGQQWQGKHFPALASIPTVRVSACLCVKMSSLILIFNGRDVACDVHNVILSFWAFLPSFPLPLFYFLIYILKHFPSPRLFCWAFIHHFPVNVSFPLTDSPDHTHTPVPTATKITGICRHHRLNLPLPSVGTRSENIFWSPIWMC